MLPVRDQTQFHSLLRWAVLLPVFFALLVASMFLVRVRSLQVAAHWVDHADRVIAKGFELEKLMLDSESGLRGYIINLESEFLEPYESASKQLPLQFKTLQQLIEDQPHELNQIREIENTAQEWLSLAQQVMAAISNGADPLKVAPNSEGKRIMDRFRQQMDAFILAEQNLRDVRAREAEKSARMAAMNGLLLAVLLAVFLTVFTRKSLKALSKTHQKVLDEVQAKANELAESEARLRAIAEDLELAVRSRDDFLSVASHELKTPLTVLKLQLQLNSRAIKPEKGLLPSPEKLVKFFDTCLDQTNRLDNLVEDLLDVTRIQQGTLAFHFEEFDLSQLIKDEVDQFCEPLKFAKCPIELINGGSVHVRADRFRIEQVFVNLLTNAMKYGAGRPIQVMVESDGAHARIKVKDQGIGIDPIKQSIIFDRFERVMSNQNVGGMGLGLFIAKQIINAHEGSIEVQSELGKGATFIVTLPVASKEHHFSRTVKELA